jgi:hypothetical protein
VGGIGRDVGEHEGVVVIGRNIGTELALAESRHIPVYRTIEE